ncbi:HHR076Wp [Eremothecium sinecaudum]|uniref:Actin cytoskeleton-regulatory complex protein END3 n=1 Tax=Eremothecium sinecaudum TaxID=45286 RepID=A0A120K2W8_9SACH|nr:HHR076Wp [Eremothecium sinecaudum]AMD22845.1 HHR076Wp [Eremothecium sinecaudum]
MPKLEQFEIKKYWQIFTGLVPKDNKVTHDQVLPILHNSKLDSSILNKIWFLADIDDDDNLDFEEFVICMRLIFDMVNHNTDSVPDRLPDWLIPGSKADLVKKRESANERRSGSYERSDAGNSSPPELEWYISPSDKVRYESLYEQCRSSLDGGVTFSSLSSVANSQFHNVSSRDIEQVWKLVNPKNFSTIDKDPVLYVLHILKQRNDIGVKIPTIVPTSLNNVFSKERQSTDYRSEGQSQKSDSSQRNSGSERTEGNKESNDSATKGTDWEVLSLQKELANLEKELAEAVAKTSSIKQSSSKFKLIQSQFEELLKFKQHQISKASDAPSALNLIGLNDDIDSLESQVSVLEQYSANRRSELQQLRQEIHNFR